MAAGCGHHRCTRLSSQETASSAAAPPSSNASSRQRRCAASTSAAAASSSTHSTAWPHITSAGGSATPATTHKQSRREPARGEHSAHSASCAAAAIMPSAIAVAGRAGRRRLTNHGPSLSAAAPALLRRCQRCWSLLLLAGPLWRPLRPRASNRPLGASPTSAPAGSGTDVDAVPAEDGRNAPSLACRDGGMPAAARPPACEGSACPPSAALRVASDCDAIGAADGIATAAGVSSCASVRDVSSAAADGPAFFSNSVCTLRSAMFTRSWCPAQKRCSLIKSWIESAKRPAHLLPATGSTQLTVGHRLIAQRALAAHVF